jgi:hypothetical protein
VRNRRVNTVVTVVALFATGLVAAPGGGWSFQLFSPGSARAQGRSLPPKESPEPRPAHVVQQPTPLGFQGPQGPQGGADIPEWFNKEDQAAKERGRAADAKNRRGSGDVDPNANVDGKPLDGVGPSSDGAKSIGASDVDEVVFVEGGAEPKKGRRGKKKAVAFGGIAGERDSGPIVSVAGQPVLDQVRSQANPVATPAGGDTTADNRKRTYDSATGIINTAGCVDVIVGPVAELVDFVGSIG